MINGDKILGTISPSLDTSVFHGQTGGNDILFDWVPLVIPRGACMLTSIGGTIMGVNGTAANGNDFRLYFAKSINGVAPSSFGTAHAAQGVNQAAGFRRNILGALFVDMSAIDDADNLIAYNVFQTKLQDAASTSGEFRGALITLEGEPNVTRTGFQTIYVAMEATGTVFDFGTDVDLNMAGSADVAADMTGASVALTTSGTDPQLVFQPGDILGGHTGTVEMEVVSVDSATTMTVKNITDIIDHAEQLIIKNPITLNFGLEY
tara:strand:+ start:951 stop:1739 length:789 start_codon:yes stop_codon:yes gene_type:complete